MIFSEERKIFIGGAVVATLSLVFVLFSGRDEAASANDDSYKVMATFNRVDGLLLGDEVRLGGVRIGTVTRQTLNENFQAKVDLMIDREVKLPMDTSAAIHTDGLFGSKYVVLDPGGEEDYLADGGAITFTQDALIVSELLELIIAQGKQQAKEAAEAKAQIKKAAKILSGQQEGN